MFINIVIVLFNKIEDVVLDGQPPLHPFIRCFLKSISLMIFLLKLAADVSLNDVYGYASGSRDSTYESTPSNPFSYSVLNQSDQNDNEADDEAEEDDDDDDGFDEVEHFAQDASWIPTAKPADFSDSGSDRSASGSIEGLDFQTKTLRSHSRQQTPSPKKRNKVRFSKMSEVRTLSSLEAQEALFSRLSYQASIRAETEAIRLANRIKPWNTTLLALKLCSFSFAFQFFRELLVFTTDLDFSPFIIGLSCMSCLVMVFVFTYTRGSLHSARPNASTDTLRFSILLSVISALMSLALSCLHATSFPTLHSFQSYHLEFVQMLVSAISFLMFVVLLRREVPDVDLLDIPLFLGEYS